MKCRKCGAELLDTDTFCVNCGQKVEKITYCPKCGEELREGEKFCHKCGAMLSAEAEDEDIPVVQQKTMDIPFEEIEQGILLQAEQAIVKRPDAERGASTYAKRSDAEGTAYAYGQEAPGRMPEGYGQSAMKNSDEYREEADPYKKQPETAGRSGERRQKPEPETRRTPAKRPIHREEEYDDYDEEEDDGENDGSKMKIVTTILGIAIVAVALVVAYVFWSRNFSQGNGNAENGTQQESEENGESEGEAENSAEIKGRLQVLSNVNVRTKPDKDDSEVIMVAKKGETYEYYELVNDAWYHIRLEDGGDGYVYKEYVEDLE